MASDWKSRREAPFEEQYSDRVGAGIILAADEIKRIAGQLDDASRSGIYLIVGISLIT